MATREASAAQPTETPMEQVSEAQTRVRPASLLAWLKGQQARHLLTRLIVIILLVDVSFIFVVPILRLISTSLMDIMDLYDPTVAWIPRRWAWENYSRAFIALEYGQAFRNSVMVAGASAILQTLSCAIIGYGFARFRFPGREKIFMLVLFAMIVPPHAIIIQLFIMVSRFRWLETYYPFIVPSAFGMGLRGALFVFIYRQFFKGMPYELEDAAMIDGAGPLRIFFNVMLPLARPAILVVFLFSFVWHWNDSLEPSIYLSRPELFFLPQRLSVVESALANIQLRGMWGTGTIMSATLLVILPLLVLYMFTQRYFVESIERTGLID
jgi:multiple sugar transport system permease protein